MRSPRRAITELFDNPVLVGTVTILVVIVAVYLSYIAENGLPFIPTYDIKVQVADGGELSKNVDVRIGGARVGQVLTVTPEPADAQWPHPYAQLELQLEKSLQPLPEDTHYQVRLASVLGGQYLELFPGKIERQTVPDGGTLAISSTPALNHNIPYVDISQAFDVFGPRTEAGLRSVASDLGAAFAGRGTDLNDALAATAQVLPALHSVLGVLASHSTDLTGFLGALASATTALAPAAPTVDSLLRNASSTFAALDSDSLGQALSELPGTESEATSVLERSLPELNELASITRSLEPAGKYLPISAERLDAALRAAPATLELLSPLARKLEAVLATTKALAADPAATETFKVLGVYDLGTAGLSSFLDLGGILRTIYNAQLSCNVGGLWVSSFASTLSEGNSAGPWLRVMPMFDLTHLTQPPDGPNSNLHIDSTPIEGGGQCQAGNEVYSGTQAIDHPGHTSATVTQTAPPVGVLALAQKAGLIP
jgi:virulence factor Mce-like protein